MNSTVMNTQRDAVAIVDESRMSTLESGASGTAGEQKPVLQWTTRLRDFFVEENRYEIDALSFAMKMKEAEFTPQQSQEEELAERSQKRQRIGAGVIHSVESGASAVAFPPEFDCETFLQYYKEGRGYPFVVHRPKSGINKRYESGDSYYSRDDYRPYERLAVENRGKPVTTHDRDVTVLWLSPTVFISSHLFKCRFQAYFAALGSVTLKIRPFTVFAEIDETLVYENK
jgi:hypothetical protein